MAMIETWQAFSSFLTPTILFLLLNLVIATIFLSSRQNHHSGDPSASITGPLFRTTSPVLDRLRSFTLHRFRSGEIPSYPNNNSHNCNPSISYPNSHPSLLSSESESSPNNTTRNYNPSLLSSESEPSLNNTTHNYDSSLLSSESGSGPEPAIESLEDAYKASISNSPGALSRASSIILDRLKSISIPIPFPFQSEPSVSKLDGADVVKSEKKKKKKTKKIGGEEGSLRRRREKVVEEEGEEGSFRRRREKVVEEEEEDLDARADSFISKFRENLKIQRLNSILNYTEMLNRGR